MRRMAPLLIAAALVAAEPVPKVAVINDFSGGLNTRMESSLIGPNETPNVSNIVFDENGTLMPRRGSVQVATVGDGPLYSQCEFRESNGRVWHIVQSSDTVQVSQSRSTSTWTVIARGINRDVPLAYASIGGRVYMSNGTDDVISWDSAVGLTTHTYIPRGRYLMVADQRLYVSGVYGSPSWVFFSRAGALPNDADSWPAENIISVNEDDGDDITGMALHLGRKVIAKRGAIYVVAGVTSSDFAVIRMVGDVGCVNGPLMQYKGALVFLAADGLYAFDGSSAQQVSGRVYDDVRRFLQLSGSRVRYSISTTEEFNAGTSSDTLVAYGAVYLSSVSYTWQGSTTFAAGTRTNIDAVYDALVHSTSAVGAYGDIPFAATVTGEDGTTPMGVGYLNDTASGGAQNLQTACRLVFSGFWTVQTGGSTTKLYRLSGNDGYTISLDLGAPYNVRQISWTYSVTQPPNAITTYDERITPIVRYRDVATFDMGFFAWPNVLWHDWQRMYGQPDVTVGGGTGPLVWQRPGEAGSNQWRSFWLGSYADAVYTDKIEIRLYATPNRGSLLMGSDQMYIYGLQVQGYTGAPTYITTATYVSTSHDIGADRAGLYYWSTIEAQISTPTGTTVDLWVSTSHDNVSWGGWRQVANNGTLDMVGRYIRWMSTSTSAAAFSPVIQSVKMSAVRMVGYYTSRIFDVGTVAAWGTYSPYVVPGAATVSHYIRGAATESGVTSEAWTAIAVGGVPVISTASRYVQMRTSMTITGTASLPYVDAMTLGWYRGSKHQEAAMAVYRNRLYIAHSTSSATNDAILLLDDNGAFTRYAGISAASLLATSDQHLYYGDASASNLRRMETDDTLDSGATIETYWESPNLHFGSPALDKQLDIISVTGRSNDGTKPLYIAYTQGYNVAWTTMTFRLSSTTYTTDIARPYTAGDKYWRFKVWSSTPSYRYELRNMTIYFTEEPWRGSR